MISFEMYKDNYTIVAIPKQLIKFQLGHTHFVCVYLWPWLIGSYKARSLCLLLLCHVLTKNTTKKAEQVICLVSMNNLYFWEILFCCLDIVFPTIWKTKNWNTGLAILLVFQVKLRYRHETSSKLITEIKYCIYINSY